MTRRSERELERALKDLGDIDAPEQSFDAREGVSAPWITYDDDPIDLDVPDGWTARETTAEHGVTYYVAVPEDDTTPSEGTDDSVLGAGA